MEIQKAGDDQEKYRKEIHEGAHIFNESFKEMQKTKKFPQKKAELEKSMGEAFKAIQEAATALANKTLEEQKNQLSKDYQAYLSDPSEQNAQKVEKDLDLLSKSTE